MEDIFRNFFGFGPRGRQRDEDTDDDFYSTEEWRRKPLDPFSFFNNEQRNDRESQDGFPFSHGGLPGMFAHFHRDLFNQMMGLHKQMDEMVKSFGQVEFPPELPPSQEPGGPGVGDGETHVFTWSSPPSPFFGQRMDQPVRRARDPRDYMLKHDEEAEGPSGATPKPPLPAPKDNGADKPLTKSPFSFPPWKKRDEDKTKDTDLDGKVNDDQLLALIKTPRESPSDGTNPERRRPLFSGQSVTYSTVRGADGKVESKKVVRDSSGNEETTVTRSLGDKSHTVTTTRSSDGKEERNETMSNMDETDLPKFQEQWRQPNASSSQDPLVPRPVQPGLDTTDRDIFSRLFGFGRR